jgi:hypothetical protein
MKYEIWSEGYSATCQHEKATQLITEEGKRLWEGETFQKACEAAIRELKWDMKFYDAHRNTYWACGFFDNEVDARKSFG